MLKENETPSERRADPTGASSEPVAESPRPAPSAQNPNSLGLWVRDLLIASAISVFMVTFLYQPVRVEGTSMLPRLENRDRLFINKFVYHLSSIHHGDVVVFHYPRNPAESYIKRVIAVPGDRIWINHGRVWLNGKPLREPYVPAKYRDTQSMTATVIPPDCYFMMGDHRSISDDSRDFGVVKRDLIYGKAEFVYWPAKDAGVVQ
ncbi:MAG TPA: signal peptidase I [Terracidiphilus sp.]|nr:signal peptidase I [Terracidiphilus sp.]